MAFKIALFLCLCGALIDAGCVRASTQASVVATASKPLNIQHAVDLLGDPEYKNEGNNYVKLFLYLETKPRAAIHLILIKLKPVSEREVKPNPSPGKRSYYSNPKAITEVDYIRALQFITGGLSFVAKTQMSPAKIGFKRRQFLQEMPQIMNHWNEALDGMPQSKLNLVGYYASAEGTAIVYLAPMDAQRAIIRKWKQWYDQCGKTYPYKMLPYEDPDQIIFHFNQKRCAHITAQIHCCGPVCQHGLIHWVCEIP